ncbi:MAG: glycosyltransferase [Candidatus Hodarchaeota archaeon]
MMKALDCSIGVMAYNEEANIKCLLESLLKQRIVSCKITEIIVVASGCTDNTVPIVESIVKDHPIVKLFVQEKREGKASAIDMFLSVAKGDVVIIESGDTIPEKDTVENLVQPFKDPNVGMTGARPVPVNSSGTFMGFTVNLFWRLHHELALIDPKLGEMIAFRNIICEIPKDTAVDEASIEAIITKSDYRIHYAEDAIVRNKGPETISDFIKQRRRIMAGHKHLQKKKQLCSIYNEDRKSVAHFYSTSKKYLLEF